MFYRLKSGILLRGWEKLPYAVVNEKVGMPIFISGKEMETLRLCNGKIDFSLPLISNESRSMVREFEKHGIVETCDPGVGVEAKQEYHLYPCRYIRTAHWSITGRCNYRCRHCYMSAPEAKYGELPHDTIMKLIDELAECGVMNVTITGGEPLVRSDFFEIVDAMLEKGIQIRTIYSNGRLVREPLLKELEKRNLHPEFNMSFDGVGWHDWLRGIPGAEKAVDEAFRLCRDLGFPTASEMCLHDKNKDTLRESINYLKSVGCRSLKTNPVSNVGEWLNTGLGETITMDELFQLYLDYIPRYYQDGMPLSLMLGGFFLADPDSPKEYQVPMYHPASDPSKACVCAHARQVMYISPAGRVLPCFSLSGMEAQNDFPSVLETDMKHCLTDSYYLDFITSKATAVLNHNPECKECAYQQWCLGGCRASGLEYSSQQDFYHRDEATCNLYRNGWLKKLLHMMEQLHPDITCPAGKDEKLREALEA